MTAPADTTNNLIPQTDITAKDTTDSVITTDITTNPTDITASTYYQHRNGYYDSRHKYNKSPPQHHQF